MQQTKPRIRLFHILLKTTILLVLFNFAFLWLPDVPLGKFSIYNFVFPGRERLPYGDVPQSYSLSPFDIEAMFASHVIAGAQKTPDEYRLLLIGDSSVWGTLLKPAETLAGQLNARRVQACGKTVRAYNLGYPTLSLLKELMLLDHALREVGEPDMVIWLTTLESFPNEDQLTSPLVANNAERVRTLIQRYDLSADPNDPDLVQPSAWDQTLIGQRRAIADILRLQIYGALWAATGVDQVYPEDYARAQIDLEPSDEFHGLSAEDQVALRETLAFDVLEAGMFAANVPTLLVNEPILISNGANSDIRYNFFYPRWAYDEYRRLLAELSREHGWTYFDFWDLAPMQEFTNSGVHLTPRGEALLTDKIAEAIQTSCE
jgi:lysophospholipase L1-like esterase